MRLRNYTFALVLLLATVPAFAKEVLPWVENDYATALKHAKAAHVPIFAEAWAPW
jgi:hypothetical protein